MTTSSNAYSWEAAAWRIYSTISKSRFHRAYRNYFYLHKILSGPEVTEKLRKLAVFLAINPDADWVKSYAGIYGLKLSPTEAIPESPESLCKIPKFPMR